MAAVLRLIRKKISVAVLIFSILAAPLVADEAWDQVPGIIERILANAPVFQDLDCDIRLYGAVGDGIFDCSMAFQLAIDDCNALGGGRVVVPEGIWLTGPLRLKSNINLHVQEGGTIRFSRDINKYPLVFTRWEGIELMNYSPFIYAFEETNIAVTGTGTLDGNADCAHWWPWKGKVECGWIMGTRNETEDRNALFQMAEDNVPVEERIFGPGHVLRPQFFQPYRSSRVLIEGVTIRNSAMWIVHPVLCTNVIVQDLIINSHGPNSDGCDPESSKDVLIRNVTFMTGDDCIAVKAGRNADGRRLNVTSENIVVQNCRMTSGHGGFTMGSEISGGATNIFAEDCVMDSTDLNMAIRFKNNALRGANINNIYVRRIQMGQIGKSAVDIDYFYEEGPNGAFVPIIRNVHIDNVTVESAQYALYLQGFDGGIIDGIHLEDCYFGRVANPNFVEFVDNLTLTNVTINVGNSIADGLGSGTPKSHGCNCAPPPRKPLMLEQAVNYVSSEEAP